MKNVLILGAGQSAPYLISYMLKHSEQFDWQITLCDRDFELVKNRIKNHPRGIAVEFDVNNVEQRQSLIKNCDLVINFLAPSFQYMIASDCLLFQKHCVTASYENLQVKELNDDAIKKDILILNEMGLDPGIDHMSAMALINKIKAKGGIISSFISYGGALPAPEVQSNPFNYCITWNPRNVVMAGESGAQYMENNKIKVSSQSSLFRRSWRYNVDGIGELEAYPNRDSLVYRNVFDLEQVDTMIRATLRYKGFSETWHQIIRLGMPNETMRIPNLNEKTYAEFTEMFLPLVYTTSKLEARLANYLQISATGKIMDNLRRLGLLSNERIKGNPKTAAQVVENLLKEKLPLPDGERDMVILAHEVISYYPETNRREKITSTMIDYGEPKGFTAIAKTVGFPAAIAAKLILNGELKLRGCRIPTHQDVYPIVMKELEADGIIFKERVELL